MVRQATLIDFHAICGVYRRVWPAYEFTPLTGEVDFIAEYQGQVVGVVRLVQEYGGLVRRGRVVLPEFRGRGFGNALIAAVHKAAAGRPYFSVATVESAHQSANWGFVQLDVEAARALLASVSTLQALVDRADRYHREEEQRYALMFHPGHAVEGAG